MLISCFFLLFHYKRSFLSKAVFQLGARGVPENYHIGCYRNCLKTPVLLYRIQYCVNNYMIHRLLYLPLVHIEYKFPAKSVTFACVL